MNKEGSLYILERSQQPLIKVFLLNRKDRDDLTDFVTDRTEFKEQGQFVSYIVNGRNDTQARRVLYFSLLEEKEKFLSLIKNNNRF